jgi:hypothetical protein
LANAFGYGEKKERMKTRILQFALTFCLTTFATLMLRAQSSAAAERAATTSYNPPLPFSGKIEKIQIELKPTEALTPTGRNPGAAEKP